MNIIRVCCGDRVQNYFESGLQEISSLKKRVKETGNKIFEQIKLWNKLIGYQLALGAFVGVAFDTDQNSGFLAIPNRAIKGSVTAALGFSLAILPTAVLTLTVHKAHKIIGRVIKLFSGISSEGEINANDPGLLLGGLIHLKYWHIERKIEVQKEALIAVALSAILGAAIEFSKTKKPLVGAIKSVFSTTVMIALSAVYLNSDRISCLFLEKAKGSSIPFSAHCAKWGAYGAIFMLVLTQSRQEIQGRLG